MHFGPHLPFKSLSPTFSVLFGSKGWLHSAPSAMLTSDVMSMRGENWKGIL